MKLTELEPRWFDALDRSSPDGVAWKRAGFTFLCPHCRETRIAVLIRPLKKGDQFDALAKAHPDNHGQIVPAGFVWEANGEDFATISLAPSVDASASGHWHGFITGGEAK